MNSSPSSACKAAVATLQEFEDANILAWTKLLRSFTPTLGLRPNQEVLSSKELDALSTLRHYPDEAVIAWLRTIRQDPDKNEGSCPSASYPSRRNSSQNSLSSTYGSACNSALLGGSISTGDTVPRQSQLQGARALDPHDEDSPADDASTSTIVTGQAHPHWCTVCEKPAPIKTCDGWKRHEKEQHEIGFLCMPNGPVEMTTKGRRCAFCRLLNPDQKHLDLHGTVLCVDRSMKDRRFTRRIQLVKHLKTHGILNDTSLADSWRVTLKNKYHSCGFCVSIFLCIGDRLNHIDSLHFRRFQSIDEWDPNKVVRGLLLQPKVLEYWKAHSAWDTRSANLVWAPNVAVNLRTRLQISEEPPERLASDALHQCKLVPDPLTASVIEHGGHQITTPQATQLMHGHPDPTCYPGILQPPTLKQWDVMAIGPADVHSMELHPPQVLDEPLFKRPASSFVYDASTLPNRLSKPSHDDSLREMSLDKDLYTTLLFDRSQHHCNEELSQGGSSTLNSWYSSSLASTNTSVHSLPSTLQYPRYNSLTGETCRPPKSYRTISPPLRQNSSFSEHTKCPSMIAQLKRRFSRVRMRDVNIEPETLMDIDVDDMMRIMEDDQQTRSHVDTRHETILYGETLDQITS